MGFAVVAQCWSRAADLPHAAKAVLLALASYADKDGKCWPSIPTLAIDSSVSRGHLFLMLAGLERVGAVRSTKSPGRSTHYEISPTRPTIGPVWLSDPSGEQTRPTIGPTRPTIVTAPVRLSDPKDPIEEPKKDPKEAPAGLLAEQAPTSPAVQATLHLEPSPSSAAPLPGWAKAAKVRDLWNRLMPDQPPARPDPRANRVLVAALDLHGEDGLRELLTWAHGEPWHSGRKKAKPVSQWMARDSLAAVAQDRKNATATYSRPLAADNYRNGDNY
jgi:hypothetical protein